MSLSAIESLNNIYQEVSDMKSVDLRECRINVHPNIQKKLGLTEYHGIPIVVSSDVEPNVIYIVSGRRLIQGIRVK